VRRVGGASGPRGAALKTYRKSAQTFGRGSAELAEILQFLSQWLARDPARLGASLEDFVGNPAYGISQLRHDLERFVFLLDGSDGEPLFGLPPS
jgi:hypothetical protein